jgi:hypothetical protein
MACAIALVTEGAPLTIDRREPTEAELEDPEVLVLDVGGRHEPEKNNYDHHQFPREHEPECALTLYCRARGLHEMLSLRKWYRTTALIDSKGPYEAAKELGLPRFPFELSSPIEAALLEAFEEETELKAPKFLSLLMLLGKSTLDFAKRAKAEYDEALSSVKVIDIDGVVQILAWECETPKQSQAVRDDHFPAAAISISHDDRGEGWSLYRFNDHPNVDFSQLEGDPAISFAHEGGFIAKTRQRISLEELGDLCGKALRTRKWKVVEWDDSVHEVETLHRGEAVLMKYGDGLVHCVHVEEFEKLKPVAL